MRIHEVYSHFPYPLVPIESRPTELSLAYYDARSLYLWSGAFAPAAIPPRPRILVAGCGTGWDALQYALANPDSEVVGVDLSPSSIELARRRAEHHGIGNLTLFVHDVSRPLEGVGGFDLLASHGVLHHMPDPDLGLRHLVAVARPSSCLVHLTLYSQQGRHHIRQVRELLRLLGIEKLPPERQPGFVRNVLTALPATHPLRARTVETAFGPEYYLHDVNIADTFLVEYDHSYSLAGIQKLLGDAGLALTHMTDESAWVLPDELSRFSPLHAETLALNGPSGTALGENLEVRRRHEAIFELLLPDEVGGYSFLAVLAGLLACRAASGEGLDDRRFTMNPHFLAAVEEARSAGHRELARWPFSKVRQEMIPLGEEAPWRVVDAALRRAGAPLSGRELIDCELVGREPGKTGEGSLLAWMRERLLLHEVE